MSENGNAADSAVDIAAGAGRLRPLELTPWLAIIAGYFLFPDYILLGYQTLIAILFALSLDLALGYAGIVTLGHAAFFGVGAYAAGIYAVRVTGEPLSGLVVATAVAGIFGLVSGLVILRTRGLTLLMLTLAILFLVSEAANQAHSITGGTDGLQGMDIDPLLGVFRFDFYGNTSYWYCAGVLFIAWAFARRLVVSPFGRSLIGVRENADRMRAIGAPVLRRLVTVYTISAAMAGLAGGLLAQTTESVSMGVLSFERSGGILIMLVLGGAGRIYGAFIGAALFMILQDRIAEADPVFWDFWIGLLLVLVVMFARGGVLGLWDRLAARLRRRA